MAVSSTKSAFLDGLGAAWPFVLVVFPFGLVFGVIATQAGLNLLEVLSFSIIVLAGAAQLTALQLMQDNAPAIVVLGSALAVNLRLVMYSAALTPHLGQLGLPKRLLVAYTMVDQNYAISADRFERPPPLTLSERLAYFLGASIPTAPVWWVGTLVGALAGTAMPGWLPLDFAVPIAFIALVAPGLRTPAHIVAAATSVALALLFAWLPWNLGLMVAGLGAMMAGARTELVIRRRAEA